jgi:hypothetical protein
LFFLEENTQVVSVIIKNSCLVRKLGEKEPSNGNILIFRVSDPDWIRIQDGKNDLQKYKKVKKFHVLSAGYSLLRAAGFSCSLDVLY